MTNIPNFDGHLNIYFSGHCNYCNKIFIVNSKEITKHFDRGATIASGYTVRCPHCGSILDAQKSLNYPYRDSEFVCWHNDHITYMDRESRIYVAKGSYYEYKDGEWKYVEEDV